MKGYQKGGMFYGPGGTPPCKHDLRVLVVISTIKRQSIRIIIKVRCHKCHHPIETPEIRATMYKLANMIYWQWTNDRERILEALGY